MMKFIKKLWKQLNERKIIALDYSIEKRTFLINRQAENGSENNNEDEEDDDEEVDDDVEVEVPNTEQFL